MEIFKPIKPDFLKCIKEKDFSSISVVTNISKELNNNLLEERELLTIENEGVELGEEEDGSLSG